MGQVFTHREQLLQRTVFTSALLDIHRRASCGQIEMHPPQAKHISFCTYALGFAIGFTSGDAGRYQMGDPDWLGDDTTYGR